MLLWCLLPGGGDAAAGSSDDMATLESCITGTLLERTLERGQLQVSDAQARFDAAQARLSAGKKVKDRCGG